MSKEKRNLNFQKLGNRFKSLTKRDFVKLVIILNAVNFIVPLIWVTLFMLIVYSPHDSIMGWILLIPAVGYFSFSFHFVRKDKNTLFNIGLLLGLVPLYCFIGYFTVYHFILVALNIIAVKFLINLRASQTA